MTNAIKLSTTHQTHDFLSRLNQEQKLEHEIYQFVKSIEMKNHTLDEFRSKFIDLYWNNNYYTPNKNSYLKLFVTLINYLQNAERGNNIKDIPWFNDVIKQAKLNQLITHLISMNSMNSHSLSTIKVYSTNQLKISH